MKTEDDDPTGWKAVNKARQEKRWDNLRQSTQALIANDVKFESKNDGVHLIIQCEPKIDFYPSTGLWIVRGNTKKQRGVRKLIQYIKDKATDKQP